MSAIAAASAGAPPATAGSAAEPGRPTFDPRHQPPEVLYLAVPASDVCNYRCRHCHIWLQQARPEPLTRARRLELVEEFARLSPGGTVVLPGGEVTLDLDELLAVAGACRDHGLPLVALSNGSRIQDQATADRLVGSGITTIAISLDSHRAELHDYTRGVAGAFDETVRAIRLLVAAARSHAPAVSVQTAAVIFRENLPELPEYVEFCRALGVRHVDFQILARTFANAHKSRDVFFEKHFWSTLEERAEAKRRISATIERYAGDPILVKQPDDLAWILAYVDDPDFRTESPVCGSHHRNLFVDAEGNVALCFNTTAILAAPFSGNVRDASLAEIWAGPKAAADRAVMDSCTLNCGALNCHRRRDPSVPDGAGPAR